MKNLRKVLSVVLAVAMMACSMVIAASPASAEGEAYATIKSWGITEFNNFDGSGLTSDAPHEVLARDKSVGWKGYAIYGMASGNVVTIKAGSTYVFELDLDYNGLYVPGRNPDENALIADFYIQDYDHCVEWAVSANSLQAAIDEGKFGYTSDGVRYVTVSGEVTIPTEIGGETLSSEVGGEARLWTRGIIDYRAINMRVYDANDILGDPVGEWCFGDYDAANDETGIRTNPYIENGNYTLPRGFRVMRGDFAEPKLALGGATHQVTAGQYAAKYDLLFDGVFCGDDDVLATLAVKNEAGETVATKDVKKADTTRTIKDSEGGNTTGSFYDGSAVIDLPFAAAADGKYTIEVYTTGKANITVNTVGFTAVIPAERIAEVKEAIDAIGEVKYDPDIPEDSGDAITNARTKYDALEADYGDISNIIDNAPKLTAAESTYQGKISDYNDMVTASKAVKEAIDAIPLPVTKESVDFIVVAREGFDSFVASYGKAKMLIHIGEEAKKKLEDAEAAIPGSDVMYGDIDGDKAVTATDALWALQAYVGSRELDEAQTKAADVNLDEAVDTSDALAILQFAVKLRDKLPTVEVK